MKIVQLHGRESKWYSHPRMNWNIRKESMESACESEKIMLQNAIEVFGC